MRTRRMAALAAALGSTLLLAYCGASAPSSPTPNPGGPGGGGGGGQQPPVSSSATILAAGDIGECGFGALETGALLDRLPGTLLALGDLAYMQGTHGQLPRLLRPGVGPSSRSHPAGSRQPRVREPGRCRRTTIISASWPGRAAWATTPSRPARGGSSRSTASCRWGSARRRTSGCATSSRRTGPQCTLAYWHRPLFSSGPNGNNPDTAPLWRTLAEFGGEVVLNAHDHMYEVFARQDADGRPNARPASASSRSAPAGRTCMCPARAKPNSQVRLSVLRDPGADAGQQHLPVALRLGQQRRSRFRKRAMPLIPSAALLVILTRPAPADVPRASTQQTEQTEQKPKPKTRSRSRRRKSRRRSIRSSGSTTIRRSISARAPTSTSARGSPRTRPTPRPSTDDPTETSTTDLGKRRIGVSGEIDNVIEFQIERELDRRRSVARRLRRVQAFAVRARSRRQVQDPLQPRREHRREPARLHVPLARGDAPRARPRHRGHGHRSRRGRS